MEQPVDERMHVFVRCVGYGAGRNLLADLVETADEARTLAGGEHLSAHQRSGPGLRELYVTWPQAKIHADRTIHGIQCRIGPFGETSAPELVRGGGA